MKIQKEFLSRKEYVEKILQKYMPSEFLGYSEVIIDAMNYSLFAGGKRIRPILMLETFKSCGGKGDSIEGFMAAIEMIHTYSLIHDDLPAMDNDDLRRGKPTCHIKFGEDIAILAGDGLLNYAFETMMSIDNIDRKRHLDAMRLLSKASGIYGMVGGQVADIIYEGKKVELDVVNYIHSHKTSALIEASFMIGAIVSGAPSHLVDEFQEVGRKIGLAFQIQDDLLDVLSTEEELGKPIRSDDKNEKVTYVSIMGVETSLAKVEQLYKEAIDCIQSITENEDSFLVTLLEDLRHRKK